MFDSNDNAISGNIADFMFFGSTGVGISNNTITGNKVNLAGITTVMTAGGNVLTGNRTGPGGVPVIVGFGGADLFVGLNL
jgi:hypothetical protein